MALTKIKRYQHLITQDGVYVHLFDEDRVGTSTITWPILGYIRTEVVDCMVVETNATGTYEIFFRDEGKAFLSTVSDDYHIWMYGIPRHVVAAAYILDDIVWSDESVWKCAGGTSTTPSVSNPLWLQITDANTDELNSHDDELKNDYFYRATYAPADGNITVIKTGDHTFTVIWNGTDNVDSWILRDYEGGVVDYGSAASNSLEFLLTEDGAYTVDLILDTTDVHYAEIWDFTDAEKCYLDLIKNVLCDCVECDDCPGPLKNKALHFVTTYQLLRDAIYVDQAARVGLVSTETLREEYIATMGLMIKKLGLLINDCTCTDNTE